MEDEHGQLIETADCGLRCPGCGVCCAGYRDVITVDLAGEEEFEGNLQFGRGGLIKLEGGQFYAHRIVVSRVRVMGAAASSSSSVNDRKPSPTRAASCSRARPPGGGRCRKPS